MTNHQDQHDEPPPPPKKKSPLTYFAASYGILVCTNVFYNIFNICNDDILIEQVSHERSFNRMNAPMRWTKPNMEKWNL